MIKSQLKRHLLLSIFILPLFIFGSGCSYLSKDPENILMLTAEPMGHTAISYYLPISTLYDSDAYLYLIALWGENIGSANHTMRWEIHDGKGVKIFSSPRKDFNIRANAYSQTPVVLKDILRKSQAPEQLTVRLFIDDKPVKSMQIAYKNKRITGNSDQMVVILPFIEENQDPTPWADGIRTMFQNTTADAIYCEVSRIFPDTIPHYVVEQKVGRHLDPNCLKDTACASFLKDSFGENVFIYGNLSIQKFDLDASTLTVFVYDMKSKRLKKFHYFQRYMGSYASLVQDLLAGVLYEKGLLAYMGELGDFEDQADLSNTTSERQEEDEPERSEFANDLR
jgi:hypothetical protein